MSQVLNVVTRKLNSNSVSLIIAGVSSIYIGIAGTANTFLIHQYQQLFQAYENSNPVATPDDIKEKFHQVLEDLKVEELDKELSKVFMSIRPELHHIGVTNSKYSFRLGIPLNFTYKSSADINPNMKIESKYVDWNSDEGKTLRECLVLSEYAQKFAMAQEIYKCDNISFYLNVTYPTLGVSLAYFFATKGHEKYQLYQKPIQARIVFYAGACLFGYGLYVLLTDKTQLVLEQMSLKKVCSLGKEYIEGGIEYFSKQLQINKALRNLLHDGESTIAVTGNSNYFIRQKSLPLTHQKSFLEEELKKLSRASEEESFE